MKLTQTFLLTLTILSWTYGWSQSYHLELKSSDSLENKVLESLTYQKRYSELDQLRSEIDTILYTLERRGYFDRELISLQRTNDSTYQANLKLNSRYQIIRIFYENFLETDLIKNYILEVGTDYFEISIDNLEKALEMLSTKISNQGDPFFSLQLSDISRISDNKLSAHLKMVSNKARKVDKIILRGYEKFPQGYVKNFLSLKNKKFNLEKIKSKASRINNLEFAKQTREPEILFTPDSSILYIYIEKIKSNAFDGFLGFGTTNQSAKLQFNGYLNLQLVNTLNYGETFRVYYRSDENEQRTFDAQIKMPFILKTPIGIRGALNIFKRDSTFLTSTQYAALEYDWNGINSISAGFTVSQSSDLLNVRQINLDDYNSIFYLISFSRIQNSEDPLFPIGHIIDLSAGVGKRDSDQNRQPQTRWAWDLQKTFFLNDRNNVFSRVNGGFLISDSYLQNELFRFGGINSIRGFRENSLEGNLYAILNTEYRFKLSPSLYIHSVLDAAYFENQILNVKEKLYGFGFGIGLLTQTGLFKINYSGSKVGNQDVKVADFKIHISLTANF